MPLQWMLGLRRLKLDAIWLELLPATDDAQADEDEDRKFPEATARARIGRAILFALSETGIRHA